MLKHLRRHGTITPAEALTVYKITRLAARIEELRRAGNRIERSTRIDGAGARYSRYMLAGKGL